MPERQAFIDRVKGAEREFYIVVAAIAHFRPAVRSGVARLPERTTPRDLVAAAVRVEPTYLIRMWTEFEMAIRSYHLQLTGHDDIKAVNLVDWTAGNRQGRAVPGKVKRSVHEVREYRNFLIHGNPAPAVSIEEARSRLNSLLQCLPIRW